MTTHVTSLGTDEHSSAISQEERLRHAINHAAHYLPSQGPIAVFVHHNTLHAFEYLPFDQAVIEGFRHYGANPYWSESRYRDELKRGRILESDLQYVLRLDLGRRGLEEIAAGTTRYELRYNMVCHPVEMGNDAQLRWLIAQSDALEKFRDCVPANSAISIVESTRHWIMRDLRPSPHKIPVHVQAVLDKLFHEFPLATAETWNAERWQKFTLNLLWMVCQHGANATHQWKASSPLPKRQRDVLKELTDEDCDEQVHELIIRFTSAFLDQGFAPWGVPNRELGYFRCFVRMFADNPPWAQRWLTPFRLMVTSEGLDNITPCQSIALSLEQLGVPEERWDAFIQKTMLALPGWAGMVNQMATNASWTLRPAAQDSLEEFLAVRLLLDRLSIEDFIRTHSDLKNVTAADLLSVHTPDEPVAFSLSVHQRAFALFQMAQRMGWNPKMLCEWTQARWQFTTDELAVFDDLERRRIFHLGYEHRYRSQILDAISEHARGTLKQPAKVKLQVVTCIDDREESFRRHLEEIDPQVETFGAAGFFSVPMFFRGAADAHFIPLCPVIVTPKNFVEEVGPLSAKEAEARRSQTRRLLGKASHQVHLSSRSLISGTLTSIFGCFGAFPLVARVLFPRTTANIRRHIGSLVRPTIATQLRLEHYDNSETTEKGTEGFTLVEMANMVERLLGDLGIRSNFAPLIMIFGHGSSSLNNPHESAYNCGACGGGRGGPNARAFAHMANDPRVRTILASRSVHIPSTTVFIGGYHNTCDDSITYFDLERMPLAYENQFLEAKEIIEEARRRNAHERGRRFESLELSSDGENALKHVESRSEDLAQARPEYNHATNAACFVGRRSRTRGLYMDRRCFLTSYDPTTDDSQWTILNRIMQAVIPVCGGINLEYYFSTVDNAKYGCGSKLPHNITSLLGVMEGAASDLRTGLSQQMVEIHEPIRILFIVETTPEAIWSIMERNPLIDTYIRNKWVQIATLDPDSDSIQVFQHDEFEKYHPGNNTLPNVKTSIDWYRGWRDHLGFARIEASLRQLESNHGSGSSKK